MQRDLTNRKESGSKTAKSSRLGKMNLTEHSPAFRKVLAVKSPGGFTPILA